MKLFKKLLLSATVSSMALLTIGASTAIAQDTATTPSSVSFTNDNGVLELLSTPESFAFGEIEVSTATISKTISSGLSVSLSDFRPITAENNGWNLTAQLTAFTSGGVQTLTGAELDFSNIVFTQLNTSINSTEPSVGTTNLTAGGPAVNLAYADRTVAEDSLDGIGPWQVDGDVTITIPELQSSVGSHTAELTWTLVDAY